MSKTFEVITKWGTDGSLAVIYEVGGLLLFYSTNKDPFFKRNQPITQEEAEKSRPYKAIPYDMDRVPNDAFIDLSFAWGKNFGGE